MRIKKEYTKFNQKSKQYYGITIQIERGNHFVNGGFKVSHLYTDNLKWIHSYNLLSEDFYKHNNIEYFKNKDDEIIPIGLINFDMGTNYKDNELYIIVDTEPEVYDIDRLLNNIDEAIKYRYKSVLFYKKFNDNSNIEYTEL